MNHMIVCAIQRQASIRIVRAVKDKDEISILWLLSLFSILFIYVILFIYLTITIDFYTYFFE
jgi:hypothetical protein